MVAVEAPQQDTFTLDVGAGGTGDDAADPFVTGSPRGFWETGMYAPRGASVTILTLLAVSSNFPFEAETEEVSPVRLIETERPSPATAPRRLADSGPVNRSLHQNVPAQRLTFEAARAAQTDRRTGTYNSTYSESPPSASVRRREVPM